MSEDLVVILAGQPGPIADLLRTSPALAARFRAIIHFPGYTPRQLAAVFAALADEAGFTLSPDAAHKAAAALAQAESGHSTGSARLAIRLLDEAADAQARRIASAPHSHDPIAVTTISATDIPEQLDAHHALPDDPWPGQYL